MKAIKWENLIPGDIYYIERIIASNLDKESGSGKKVGTFLQILYYESVGFGLFNNLSDLPNATKPSGMGSWGTNQYSTLNSKFYKPSATEKIERVLAADEEERKMRETLIDVMLNPKNGKGNYNIADYAKYFLEDKCEEYRVHGKVYLTNPTIYMKPNQL